MKKERTTESAEFSCRQAAPPVDQLLDKNSEGTITAKEKQVLEQLVAQAEELMVANCLSQVQNVEGHELHRNGDQSNRSYNDRGTEHDRSQDQIAPMVAHFRRQPISFPNVRPSAQSSQVSPKYRARFQSRCYPINRPLFPF